jgi:putative aminopeptidase FrvX
MKEYKFIFPDTSDIEVGDVVEFNGVRHVLTKDERCSGCSLDNKCGNFTISLLCGGIENAAFKIEKP